MPNTEPGPQGYGRKKGGRRPGNKARILDVDVYTRTRCAMNGHTPFIKLFAHRPVQL